MSSLAHKIIVPATHMKLKSKSNFRMDAPGKAEWKKLQAWGEELKAWAMDYVTNDWPTLDLFQGDGCAVFSCVANSKLDSGNFSKSVLDIFQGMLYSDDARVMATLTQQVTEGSGFVLGFGVPVDNDPATLAAACWELHQQVLATMLPTT